MNFIKHNIRQIIFLFVLLLTLVVGASFLLNLLRDDIQIDSVSLSEHCFNNNQTALNFDIVDLDTYTVEYIDVAPRGIIYAGNPTYILNNTVAIRAIQADTFFIDTSQGTLHMLFDDWGESWLISSSVDTDIAETRFSFELGVNGQLSSILSTPNGNCFVTILSDRIDFWDVQDEMLQQSLSIDLQGEITMADLNTDGSQLAFTSGDNDSAGQAIVVILDLTGNTETEVIEFRSPILHLQYCGDNAICAIVTTGELCVVSDELSVECEQLEILNASEDITTIDYVQNYLLLGLSSGHLSIFDLSNNTLVEMRDIDTIPIKVTIQDTNLVVYAHALP